jgi:hypothetical protein
LYEFKLKTGPERKKRRKRSESLGPDVPDDYIDIESSTELLAPQPLELDPPEVGLTARSSPDIDLEALRGHNMTNGTSGFGSDAIPIVALVDTGSDHTFISNRTLEKLVNPVIKLTAPITVRLTNGVVTTSNRFLRAGITLGICNFRVLEWNAYDVILGMDWLKRHEGIWDVAESRLGLVNGSGRRSYVQMRSHKTLEAPATLAELGLNAISCKKAQKAIRERPESIQLYLVRDKEGKKKYLRNLPHIVNSRYESIVKYRSLFREELPKKLAPKREIQHDIDTGDAKPVNLPYYSLSQEHRVEQENQIRTLLEKGLIRPSASVWGFPVLFVGKPGGKWRMCIDYRMLNNVTRKDA